MTIVLFRSRKYGNLFYANRYTVEKLTIGHVAGAARPAQLHHQRTHVHVHIFE